MQQVASSGSVPLGMSLPACRRVSPSLRLGHGSYICKSRYMSHAANLVFAGFGRCVVVCPHGNRCSQLPALARDAPQGASSSTGSHAASSGEEIIVLGLSPEALVTATPIGGTPNTSSSRGSSRASQDTGSYSIDSQLPVLVDAQAVLASSQANQDAAARSPLQPNEVHTPSASGQDADAPHPKLLLPQTDALSAAALSSSETVSTRTSHLSAGELSRQASNPASSSSGRPSPTQPQQPLTAHEQPQQEPHPLPQNRHQQQQEAQQQQQESHQPLQQQQQPGLWHQLSSTLRGLHWGKLWALALLFISYVHQATTGFALPAMLPMISNELHLTDLQGALLTTGYSYLYAVALVPIGILADRMSRPKLLAAGLALWSLLTCTASTCRSFGELILARVGFAAAQGAQNPVCFSLIPELFPVNKSTALSLYNCAIYVGRALSFGAVLLARHLHDNDQAHLAARGGLRLHTRLRQLDRADLHSLSIMHTAGDMAAATPDREFNFPLWEYGSDLPDSAWRQVLRWIAVPGFLIGLALIATLQEPRNATLQQQQHTAAATPPVELVASGSSAAKPAAAAVPTAAPAPPLTGPTTPSPAAATAAAAATTPLGTTASATSPENSPAAAPATSTPLNSTTSPGEGSSSSSPAGGMWALLRSRGFMSVTLAAALNDVGSYALIAWQSTFYERVYGLESSAYAPVLATLLPIGGILGGVGGGYLADRLSRCGRRWWVTAGATCLAAPCLAASCLAPSPQLSYAALVVGFALSEMWRAPSAVMARGLAPASMGSTASALYLCVRNLLGGLGPLAVAALAGGCGGLQRAMLVVVPAMYLGSGLLFAKAEELYEAEMGAKMEAAKTSAPA
ncbi:hypothetical protein Agub_g8200 [Astrephomene gubernaculifera]|uniref:Major facilitator superfamily (MFS) profile domain-containing protein n=1 Tax=Astrephomene gubernaculifera TaxID=47775 RepID=A0AAD3HMW2_9CHLO|nr:hypothetical protein Agub_g8200 [Astrephomene gubernaculifera]